MKTAHTPGPWTAAVYKVTPTMFERMTVGSLHHAVCTNSDPSKPQELLVALCGDEPGVNSQSARDARLIAAAPEMLDALKWIRDECLGLPAVARALADKAITKAEGEPSETAQS